MTPDTLPLPRRRGGQRGNHNALKHGIYSRHISLQNDEQLAPMSEDKYPDELAMARVRLTTCLLNQAAAPPEDWLSYEKAVLHYLDKIVSMIQKNAVLGKDRRIAFTTVMEMVCQVNDEQDVG